MAALYRRGGFGYGEVKKALADAAEKFWAEPRARRAELAAKPDRIREILADGAAKARKKAARSVESRAQDSMRTFADLVDSASARLSGIRSN